MPSQIYWLIDRFPDVSSAEAARTLYGTVTVTLSGEVFLQTVNDNPSFVAEGGERLGAIGPLPVPTGPDLIARFMEVTLPAFAETLPLTADGTQATFILSGSLCIETPAGARNGEASLILPAGVPQQLVSPESGARALLLVVHRSGESWADKRHKWRPTGLCGGESR